MTENGKPKYFSLMEQLKADIVSGAICPGKSFLQKMNFHRNILSAGIQCGKHWGYWNRMDM